MRLPIRLALVFVSTFALLPAFAPAPRAQTNKLGTVKAGPPAAPAAAGNYLVTQTTGAIVPGTAAVPGLLCGSNPGDDCTSTITLPFSFTLYDQTFTTANVSTNGNLQFASNTAVPPLDVCLPIGSYNYTIYPHYGDLTVGGAGEGIFTSVSGSAPNRIFNIEWRASFVGNTPGTLNFELRLYEGLDRFDVIFGTVPTAGRNATVGVQRGTGASFVEFECFGSNTVRNGQMLVFTGTADASLYIAGRAIEPDGTPIPNVTVTLSGTSSATTMTDANGDYIFSGLTSGGTYTVTASQAGQTFYPTSRTFGGSGNRAFTGSFIVNFIHSVPPNPGDVLISEFRFRGQAFGASDEFIELLNNTGSAILVNATDGSSGWLVQASRVGANGSTVSTIIPNGTVIPAGGHYLLGNGNGYNLFAYANADDFFQLGAEVPDDAGVALFSSVGAPDAAHKLDAAGFSAEPNPLYREGAGLTSPGAVNGNYSFVRRLVTGRAQDTNNNAADFVFVAPDGGTYGGVAATLGAPGPESTSSPIQRNAFVKTTLLDPPAGATAPPNRVRDTTPNVCGNSNVCAQGTLVLRRRFTNNTNAPITRLRFRVVDITTRVGGTVPAGQADVRALTSSTTTVSTSGGNVTVNGLTLEQGFNTVTGTNSIPQALGGGLNSSLSAGTITVSQPLQPNASIPVEFRLGVQQGGAFRFFINIEALP
ncbi:MAG TPA: carboxypeptidase regulatory-like domain-containing protein [Pyrinomonadaceae bacterium]|jgi:hypothetical protein